MTEQAINSSVLAEYLDVLKQMQASLEAYGYKETTGGYFVRAMDTQLSSLIPNCDALRALVAEQEQASAGEPDEVDLAVKAAFERRMHALSINVQCEEPDCALCKSRAAELPALIAKGQA